MQGRVAGRDANLHGILLHLHTISTLSLIFTFICYFVFKTENQLWIIKIQRENVKMIITHVIFERLQSFQ